MILLEVPSEVSHVGHVERAAMLQASSHQEAVKALGHEQAVKAADLLERLLSCQLLRSQLLCQLIGCRRRQLMLPIHHFCISGWTTLIMHISKQRKSVEGAVTASATAAPPPWH